MEGFYLMEVDRKIIASKNHKASLCAGNYNFHMSNVWEKLLKYEEDWSNGHLGYNQIFLAKEDTLKSAKHKNN